MSKKITEFTTSRYRIVIDRELCIGAGPCVEVAPKTYALDDEMRAYALKEKGVEDDDTQLLAAQACPTSAIFVYDIKTGKQLWPK